MRYSIICMTLFAALSICSISAAAEGKVLNNLVTELINIQSQQQEASKDYTFTNPRDGWIFISSTVSSGAGTDSNFDFSTVNTVYKKRTADSRV